MDDLGIVHSIAKLRRVVFGVRIGESSLGHQSLV
jgi:hypothetical protein